MPGRFGRGRAIGGFGAVLGLVAPATIACTPVGQMVNRTPDWPASDGRFRAEAGILRSFRCVAEPCEGIRRVGYRFDLSGDPLTEGDVIGAVRVFAAETLQVAPEAVQVRTETPIRVGTRGLALTRSLFRSPAFSPRTIHSYAVASGPSGAILHVWIFAAEQTDGRQIKMTAGDTRDAARRADMRMIVSTRL